MIQRNYKLVLAVAGLLLIVWCIKNPIVSSQYIANITTWGLQGIVGHLQNIFHT